MQRRAFVSGALSLLATSVIAAEAQQTGKVYRIGILGTGSQAASKPLLTAFHEGLQELGYVDGRNLVVDYRYADGKYERLADLAGELVALKPDVLVTGVNPSIAALKKVAGATPIVMTLSTDPVGAGFIQSLSRPGTNITGVTWDVTPETSAKRVQLLKEAVPALSRFGALYDSDPSNRPFVQAIAEAAKRLRLTLVQVLIHTSTELDEAFARLRRDQVDGAILLGGGLSYSLRSQVAELAARAKLPVLYQWREAVVGGGLMSYGVNMPALVRHSASYVDKILKGANPADLPVEQPTEFEFIINLKTAKALGLTIPPSLLLRADQVIE
jgi:putative tryptophan/tyrosine transport system substrate-binding protein